MTPEQIWRGKRDSELVDAAGRLDDYFEEGQWAILSEMARRGLRMPNGELPQVPERPVPAAPVRTDEAQETAAVPGALPQPAPRPPFWPLGLALSSLWRGEFSLPITYWGFAQLGGLLLAIPQMGLRMMQLTNAAEVIDGIALVYSVIVIVGIWRSAGRYTGNRIWADLARASTVLSPLLGLLTLLAQK